ncbi:MAG: hypothetical protein OXG37_06205 [Actinomycetia bacterium]|nr:hypothetical protein [Actinomycetes bacterium]
MDGHLPSLGRFCYTIGVVSIVAGLSVVAVTCEALASEETVEALALPWMAAGVGMAVFGTVRLVSK